MQEQYKHFRLREGGILEHAEGAIVLPSYPSPVCVVGAMANSFYDKLGRGGLSRHEFRDLIWKKMDKQTIDDLTALFVKTSDYLPYDVILSACVQCAYEMLISKRAAKATEYVLSSALENQVSEIAFPILLTGGEGGIIQQNAPAMAKEFSKINTTEDQLRITLYAFGHNAYEKAAKALHAFKK